MEFNCFGCETDFDDNKPDKPVRQIIDEVNNRTSEGVPAICPECGAIMAPCEITTDELPVWFRMFSKCPNAVFCWETEAYRSECEELVFYPGCLSYMNHGINETNLILRKVFKADPFDMDKTLAELDKD